MRPSEVLAERRDAVRRVLARHPFTNPRLFGSAARGEDWAGSDLDILVDPLDGASLYDLGALELDLQRTLGVPVDLATPGALTPDLLMKALRDARAL